MVLIQPSGSSHLTFWCLVLLSCCYSRGQRPSQCPDVIPLSVLEGGSLLFPLNISAKSLTMSKCSTSTSSCKQIVLVWNRNSKLLNSTISKRVSMPDRRYKVENASKADAADYKIIDDISEKCVALIRLTVKGPGHLPGNNWIVPVLVPVVVLVLVLVLVLLIRGRTILRRGTLAILRLLLRIPCLSTNIAASQSDGSCAASQELMETGQLQH
ncbi:uncharacterized protein [Emydura macquarii macquarii]|uniref:uncharacterized protein n=1 Tax=Emydura macquarii macquarii TaxID=1129001 RepID=UPI00352ACE3B